MADSISYTPTTWADGADGGTPITAARLNNLESGVTNAVKQANANAESIKTLGDSVSRTVFIGDASKLRVYCDETTGHIFFAVIASNGTEYRLGATKDSIYLDRYDSSGSGVTLWTK